MAKKEIGKTIAGIGKVALNVIENLVVNRIENEDLREGIKTLIYPVRGSLIVLSDNDPNDKEQMEGVWKEFLRSQKLASYTEAQLLNLIDNIEQQSVKRGLQHLVMPVLRMFQALVNADPNNKEEVAQIWLQFIRSEKLKSYLEEEVFALVAQIQNKELKESLELVITPSLKMISALVDADPNNQQQIQKILLEFVKSKELSVFVLKNIGQLLRNVGADELLIETVQLFLKDLLDDLLIESTSKKL